MNDYLDILSNYKNVKDVYDLIEEVQKLRYYYSTRQYDLMINHIRNLTLKYFIETLEWNSKNKEQPISYDAAYQNAENFLRTKGFTMLLQKGYDLSQHLKQEEINSIQQMNKPME
ncbi:MAG: hypothetical protein IKV61_03715 [Clostridia bacterium]|nr:hypothetical protein [Clostridia bacterium]